MSELYYKLLTLKHKNSSLGIKVDGLEEWLYETRSMMSSKEVEKIDKLFGGHYGIVRP